MKNKKPTPKYEWEIQVNYGFGHGWERECYEETRKEALKRLGEYVRNQAYPVRIKKVLVKLEEEEGE